MRLSGGLFEILNMGQVTLSLLAEGYSTVRYFGSNAIIQQP